MLSFLHKCSVKVSGSFVKALKLAGRKTASLNVWDFTAFFDFQRLMKSYYSWE